MQIHNKQMKEKRGLGERRRQPVGDNESVQNLIVGGGGFVLRPFHFIHYFFRSVFVLREKFVFLLPFVNFFF